MGIILEPKAIEKNTFKFFEIVVLLKINKTKTYGHVF